MSAAPITVVRFDRIDSTSLHARRLVDAPEPPTAPLLVIAAEQTGGVGRFARPWASPRGGLWCTLLAPLMGEGAPSLSLAALTKGEGGGEGSSSPSSPAPASSSSSFSPPPSILQGLGLRIGVACLETVRAALADESGIVPAHLDVCLKWPNDILINDRKVLGVLCEIVSTPPPRRPYALIGVGINANLSVDDLPPMLHTSATTLRDATGRDTDLDALADRLARALAGALAAPAARGIDAPTLAAARRHLARVGHRVVVTLPDRSTAEGVLTGLSDDGRPVLDTPSGPVTLPHGAELL